jgi:hypothetical protein
MFYEDTVHFSLDYFIFSLDLDLFVIYSTVTLSLVIQFHVFLGERVGEVSLRR